MERHTTNVILLAVILSVTLVMCDKDKWLPNDFPNPLKDYQECGSDQPSFVCDPNGYLRPRDVNSLNELIKRIRNQTRCLCSSHFCTKLNAGGIKIGVAVVKEMMTEEESKGQEAPKFSLPAKLNDAALFAQELDKSWNIGQCDDTVIIFYSVADHVLWTHTGLKTAQTLTNYYLSVIAMNNRFLFEKQEYYEGLTNLINDYSFVMKDTYKSKVKMPSQPNEPQALIGNAGATSLAHLGLSILTLLITLLLHF